MAVEIVSYRDAWPRDFAVIAADLRAILGSVAVRIDHIGSTSVRGLAAKDRIDVQVGVGRLAMLDEAVMLLARRDTPRGRYRATTSHRAASTIRRLAEAVP